jgi:hypothetical protein
MVAPLPMRSGPPLNHYVTPIISMRFKQLRVTRHGEIIHASRFDIDR